MISMILKTTLKKLRVRKHITQKELAEMCGISQGTITCYQKQNNKRKEFKTFKNT